MVGKNLNGLYVLNNFFVLTTAYSLEPIDGCSLAAFWPVTCLLVQQTQ